MRWFLKLFIVLAVFTTVVVIFWWWINSLMRVPQLELFLSSLFDKHLTGVASGS